MNIKIGRSMGGSKMKQIQAVQLTKELVQIESTDPGTYERKIKDYLKELLKLPGVELKEEEVLPGRFNLCAELLGTDQTLPALIFICHMDTVVVGDGWTLPPFRALEQDNKIYGRGACDMKSGLACCTTAFIHAATIVQQKHKKPKRTLKLICTVDEEDFMRGSEQCIKSGWVSKDDWVVDAEPTNGMIQVAHKGRTWYEVDVQGHTAHASTPWKGADAIAAMAEIIHTFHKEMEQVPTHPDLGKSTVTFGQIQGGYRPYVVPDACKLWIDLRLVPPTNTQKTTELLEKAIERAKEVVPGISVTYTITGDRPYIEKDDNSPMLEALKKSCLVVTKQEPEVAPFPGYTDTAVIAGKLGNHNCMSYGPGNLECAHQPDEWVNIDDIIRCERVYKHLSETIF